MRRCITVALFILSALFITASSVTAASFIQVADMAEFRADHTATLLDDGTVLIAGGYKGTDSSSGNVAKTVERYFPATRTFSPAGTMAVQRMNHSATRLKDGKILIAGGFTSATTITDAAEIYDPVSGQLVQLGRMAQARAGHSAMLLPDGRVLIVGGVIPSGAFNYYPTNTTEIYDPVTGSFSSAGTMRARRYQHSATVLDSGDILIAGGSTWDPLRPAAQPQAETEIFRIATGIFEAGPTLSVPRHKHFAERLMDGSVLIGGGGSVTSAELFGPVQNTFTAVGPMTAPRISASAIAIGNGSVLIVGGAAGGSSEIFDRETKTFWWGENALSPSTSGHTLTRLKDGSVLKTGGYTSPGNPCPDAELYMSVMGEFSAVGTMSFPRSGGAAAADAAGNAYIFGGWENDLKACSVEKYDFALRSFSPAGSIAGYRVGHTATRLLDGRILVAGGDGAPQLFDPATGTVIGTGPLSTSRKYHSATLLLDGTVLLAGGYCGPSERACASADIFDPLTATFMPTAGLVTAHARHAAALLPTGDVVLSGGWDGGGGDNTVEIYDAAARSFRFAGQMARKRYDHTMTPLSDGNVLIVGGNSVALDVPGGLNADTEIFTPATERFTAGPPMAMARGAHTATVLPDGSVLIAGGYRTSTGSAQTFSATAHTEVYAPETNSFNPGPAMRVPRDNHAAVSLPSGEVLILGGRNFNKGVTPTAELYAKGGGAYGRISVEPQWIDLGLAGAAGGSAPGTVAVRNDGTANLEVTAPVCEYGNCAGFRWTSSTCGQFPVALPPGKACLIGIDSLPQQQTAGRASFVLRSTDRARPAVPVVAVVKANSPRMAQAVIIESASTVASGGSISLQALVRWNDGTSSPAAAVSWSADSSLATISAEGLLVAGTANTTTTINVTVLSSIDGKTYEGTKAIVITPAGPTVVRVDITGPSRINERSSGRFAAVIRWSDGTSTLALPFWQMDSTRMAISPAGVLSVPNISADATVTITAVSVVNGTDYSASKKIDIINVPVATVIRGSGKAFAFSGGTGKISIKLNAQVSVAELRGLISSSSWVSLSNPKMSKGTASIAYAVSRNSSSEQRSGIISIDGEEISIVQMGAPVKLALSPSSVKVGAGGGKVSISVSVAPADGKWVVSHVKWSPAGSSGWMSESTVSQQQSGPKTIVLTVQSNGSGKTRSATVFIRRPAEKTLKSFKIMQEAK